MTDAGGAGPKAVRIAELGARCEAGAGWLCLYLQRFQTLEEARRIIAEFIARYNHQWLIAHLGYRIPAQARAEGWRAAA